MSVNLQPLEAGTSVQVQVPATSANLGPGYDSFGLGLDIVDTLTLSVTDGTWRAQVEGHGASYLPEDERHLVLATAIDYLASRGYRAPGLELRATNRVPHSRGMGSSAAALVGAAMAADALLPLEAQGGRDTVFQFCSRIEGHPDNVAPAVYGGFTISWTEEDDSYGTVSTVTHPDVVPVLMIPEFSLSTSTARKVLPEEVPHAEAAANSARAGLLVYALTQEPDQLHRATEDLLHQNYRAEAMPASYSLMKYLRSQGYATVISGAGPTVLCFARTPEDAQKVVTTATDEIARHPENWSVEIHGISTEGVTVEEHRR